MVGLSVKYGHPLKISSLHFTAQKQQREIQLIQGYVEVRDNY